MAALGSTVAQSATTPQAIKANPSHKHILMFRNPIGPPLSLISPGDPGFDSELSSDFPGISGLPNFEALRPFLVILRNDTSRTARAYAVEWRMLNIDGVSHPFIQRAVTTPLDMRPLFDRSIHPGQVRLLSPLFNWGSIEYQAHAEHPRAFAELFPPEDLPSSGSYVSVTPVVDGVIYGDGSFHGHDTTHILEQYFIARSAEHDEALSIYNLFPSLPTTEQLSTTLRRRELRAQFDHGRGAHAQYIRARAAAAMKLREVLAQPDGYAHLQRMVTNLVTLMPPHERMTLLGRWYQGRFSDHGLGPRAKQRGVE